MKHDFAELYAQYPALVHQMPEEFTSHEFILLLAREHQRLYVEALYDYRDTIRRGVPTPFMEVHRVLSQHFHALPDLVTHLGEFPSVNIFGNDNECAKWRKRQ